MPSVWTKKKMYKKREICCVFYPQRLGVQTVKSQNSHKMCFVNVLRTQMGPFGGMSLLFNCSL